MEEIEEEILDYFEQNKLQKINESLYLTNYQVKVLEEAHIPFTTCKDMKELLFLLSDISDDEEYDELEEVAKQIEEFHYYHETKK